MKKYLTLFTVFFISMFSFSGVFADQVNLLTISSVSAIGSNPGYVNASGKGNITVCGTAPNNVTVDVILSDGANPSNSISGQRTMTSNSTSYCIGFNGNNASPNALQDGLINVLANVASSSYSASLLTKATIIQLTAVPMIYVLGENPFVCRIRSECPDLGAVSYDGFGNKLDITSSGNVRINTSGNYTIRYSVVDAAGNVNMATRGVTVTTRTSGLSTTTADMSLVPVPNVVVISNPVEAQTSTSSTSTIIQNITPQSPSTPEVVPDSVPTVVIQVSGIVNTIKRSLMLGTRGNDVRLLQILLSHDTVIYPEAIVSSYFGSLTQKAVQKFQEKYNIVSKGLPGYGQVGPKTKAKLIEIYGE